MRVSRRHPGIGKNIGITVEDRQDLSHVIVVGIWICHLRPSTTVEFGDDDRELISSHIIQECDHILGLASEVMHVEEIDLAVVAKREKFIEPSRVGIHAFWRARVARTDRRRTDQRTVVTSRVLDDRPVRGSLTRSDVTLSRVVGLIEGVEIFKLRIDRSNAAQTSSTPDHWDKHVCLVDKVETVLPTLGRIEVPAVEVIHRSRCK